MRKQLLGMAAALVVLPLISTVSVAAPVYNWSGCYIGANAGYGWAPTDNFYPIENVGGTSAKGFLGGGQVGCDWQIAGAWVIGAQGMYDWGSLKGDNFYTPDHTYRDFTKVEAFGTVTGRLGFNVQPLNLLYVKGGWAWAKNEPHETTSGTSGDSRASYTASGWTLGAGWESRFAGNWSWFVEYNYADLGREHVRFTGNDTYHYNIEQKLHQVTVGINYIFGAPPPP